MNQNKKTDKLSKTYKLKYQVVKCIFLFKQKSAYPKVLVVNEL